MDRCVDVCLNTSLLERCILTALSCVLSCRDPSCFFRRTADTQKLTQNILAANDQRLMAISLFKQKQAAARAAATQQASAHGCAKAPAAAQLLRAAEVHGNVAAWEHLAEDDEIGWTTSAPADGSGGSSGGFQQHHHGHGSGEDRPAVIRPKRRKAGGSRTELQDVPFGMLVLEVLLDATAGAFVPCWWGTRFGGLVARMMPQLYWITAINTQHVQTP